MHTTLWGRAGKIALVAALLAGVLALTPVATVVADEPSPVGTPVAVSGYGRAMECTGETCRIARSDWPERSAIELVSVTRGAVVSLASLPGSALATPMALDCEAAGICWVGAMVDAPTDPDVIVEPGPIEPPSGWLWSIGADGSIAAQKLTPAGFDSFLPTSIDCGGPGCAAVGMIGTWRDLEPGEWPGYGPRWAVDYQPGFLSIIDGVVGQPRPFDDMAVGDRVHSVECGAAGCTAAGRRNGMGGAATIVNGIASPFSSDPLLYELNAVSCSTPADCVGVGQKRLAFPWGGSEPDGAVVVRWQSGGVVGPLRELAEDQNQSGDHHLWSSNISCPGDLGNCAVGVGRPWPNGAGLVAIIDGIPGPVVPVALPPEEDEEAAGGRSILSLDCDPVSCTGVGQWSGLASFVVSDLPSPGPADLVDPSASVLDPPEGAELLVGQSVPLDVACSDEGGAGVESCEATVDGAPVEVGAPVPSATPGDHVITVTVRDRAGNEAIVESTYSVLEGSVSTPVEGGETVSTGSEATPEVPVQTAIAVPEGTAGEVSVAPQSTPAGEEPPPGFGMFDRQVVLSGPDATAAAPYEVRFLVDASVLGGRAPSEVEVFRDGVLVAGCSHPTQAVPDPCVAGRGFLPGGDGDAFVDVRTSRFSTWSLGTRVDVPTSLVVDSVVVSAVGGLLSKVKLVQVSGRLTSSGVGLPAKPVVFSAGGKQLCAGVTAADGRVSCFAKVERIIDLLGGVTASFAGDAVHAPSTGSAKLI